MVAEIKEGNNRNNKRTQSGCKPLPFAPLHLSPSSLPFLFSPSTVLSSSFFPSTEIKTNALILYRRRRFINHLLTYLLTYLLTSLSLSLSSLSWGEAAPLARESGNPVISPSGVRGKANAFLCILHRKASDGNDSTCLFLRIKLKC